MDSKSWYSSKAIWGGIVAIAGALGDMFQNGPNPANMMAVAGAVLAIYGRIVAKGAITT